MKMHFCRKKVEKYLLENVESDDDYKNAQEAFKAFEAFPTKTHTINTYEKLISYLKKNIETFGKSFSEENIESHDEYDTAPETFRIKTKKIKKTRL